MNISYEMNKTFEILKVIEHHNFDMNVFLEMIDIVYSYEIAEKVTKYPPQSKKKTISIDIKIKETIIKNLKYCPNQETMNLMRNFVNKMREVYSIVQPRDKNSTIRNRVAHYQEKVDSEIYTIVSFFNSHMFQREKERLRT